MYDAKDIRSLAEKYIYMQLNEAKTTYNTITGVILKDNTLMIRADLVVQPNQTGTTTSSGQQIERFTIKIKTGPNNAPWPLFGLAGLTPQNSPLKTTVPGLGGRGGSLRYDSSMISESTVSSLDTQKGKLEDEKVAVESVSIENNKINVVYDVRKSPALSGEYKKFEVSIPLKSVFGREGEKIISDLKAGKWSDTDDFSIKYMKGIKTINEEKPNVTVQTS